MPYREWRSATSEPYSAQKCTCYGCIPKMSELFLISEYSLFYCTDEFDETLPPLTAALGSALAGV